MKLKRLSEQTIVLTGATSGIGLCTARMAAEGGAGLVLVARNKEALDKLCAELKSGGRRVVGVAADVASESDLERAAEAAVANFGGFDTWINNAGVSIYGELTKVTDGDSRRLFDTNFWGTVNGSRIASKHLMHKGGAIINVGSTLSESVIPLQGMYCASKHAVKGFTDALRIELEAKEAPISVTLIKPAAMDTPYKEHAKNYLSVETTNPPPVYAPEIAANAILHCAENPTRDVYVGGGAKAMSMLATYAPKTADKILESTFIEMQKTEQPERNDGLEGLHRSRDSRLNERGGYEGRVMETSLYTAATLHPAITGSVIALGLGGLLYAFTRGERSTRTRNELGH
ncbi:MAG: SDR family oxidoreductase [Pyrinomonadaceae bacterium]|nr:SDR family oxidoreductase [Pyrinomonadaceae bacterium]